MTRTKINTAKAWGYLCRDVHGYYNRLAGYAGNRKPMCANPAVRARVIRETDYRKLITDTKARNKTKGVK